MERRSVRFREQPGNIPEEDNFSENSDDIKFLNRNGVDRKSVSSQSTSVSGGGRKIKLLVCTGNMGNEKPNEASLKSWIPDDGNCLEVLEDPNYPVMFDEEDNVYEDNNEYGVTNKKDVEALEEKFDIIAVGMQESTFEEDDEDSEKQDLTDEQAYSMTELGISTNGGIGVSDNGKGGRGIGTSATSLGAEQSDFITPLAGKKKKKKDVVTKAGTKIAGAITTLSADRNYTDKDVVEAEDTKIIHDMFASRLPSYKQIVSYQRGEMRLLVFVRQNHGSTLPVTVNFVRAQNTGKAGLANKGGIAAELCINKTTRIAFVSCHLEAHEGIGKYTTRCSTMADIFQGTKEIQYPPTTPDVSLSSHFCFVMGDLNFRTRFTEENGGVNTPELMGKARQMVDMKIWQDLNAADELQRAIRNKEAFVGFETLYCNFPPTFKVQRNVGYDYKDNRTPSYTDRILWKTGHMLENNIKPLSYEPIDNFSTSDHKPMRGTFEIELNDNITFSTQSTRASRGRRRTSTLGGLWSRAGESSDTMAKKESLHLFVSEIQCELRNNCTSGGLPPNPYLCVITSPKEIIQIKENNFWLKKIFLSSNLRTKRRDDNTIERTSFGWPRTEKQKATYYPDWTKTQNDIHCVLQTTCRNGKPLNLSGAILHMSIFSHNTNEDECIGTFPFNLHNLLKSCKKNKENKSSNRSKRFSRNQSGSSSKLFQSIRSSTRNIMGAIGLGSGVSNFESDGDTDSDDDMMDNSIFSVNVEGSLLRNGKETGKITCTVEAWWMDEATALGIHTGAQSDFLHMGGGSRSFGTRSSMGRRSGYSGKTDVPGFFGGGGGGGGGAGPRRRRAFA